MEAKTQPANSNWALLRDAQLKTLSIPNTALAVTIDVGEWNDIHPLHKKEVSQRLALAAQHLAYGNEKVVYSGPLFQSMTKEDTKLSLSFQCTGGGLVARDADTLRYFAIADADKHFVWARALIKNGKVIVWNDTVLNPVAVRYAWADKSGRRKLIQSGRIACFAFQDR
jgi:sialate O-acetylesterase